MISSCADDTSAAVGVDVSGDGQLDCGADEAQPSALEPFLAQHGGEFVGIEPGVASLVVEDREQVVVVVLEVDAGWVVTRVSGCQGFER